MEEHDPKTITWTKMIDAPMEIHYFQAKNHQGEIWVQAGIANLGGGSKISTLEYLEWNLR